VEVFDPIAFGVFLSLEKLWVEGGRPPLIPQAAGGMLMFIRNRLSGSYFAFNAASRS
jgi:hypothetical protein